MAQIPENVKELPGWLQRMGGDHRRRRLAERSHQGAERCSTTQQYLLRRPLLQEDLGQPAPQQSRGSDLLTGQEGGRAIEGRGRHDPDGRAFRQGDQADGSPAGRSAAGGIRCA